MFLQIDHTTHYRYEAPVGFTPHLLRFLPRTAPGLHLLRSTLTISPEASVKWNLDLIGNLVGRATFPGLAEELCIQSSLLIEQRMNDPFDFLLDSEALQLPIIYGERERSLLTPFLQRLDESAPEVLEEWLRPFLYRNTSTLAVLIAINSAIRTSFLYSSRHTQGVWSVKELFEKREGTCRDFAHFFIEVTRSLGIAARYVSGYLCASPQGGEGESNTHGWCELYLPGAGWRGFDPTNGILADAHHVVVAASLEAGDIPPVQGTYCGAPDLCIAHEASISARELLTSSLPHHDL